VPGSPSPGIHFARVVTPPFVTTPAYRAYSVRRVSPLLGALQVVAVVEARAFSGDGDTWELQVRGEFPDTLWGTYSGGPRVYFRFGQWSAQAGLQRVSIHPVLNNASLLPASQRLLQALEVALPGLPFAPIDPWELWLLDAAEQRPLAMLDTNNGSGELPAKPIWRAWMHPVPAQEPCGPLAGEMERLIARTAGAVPALRWLRRQDYPLPVRSAPAPGRVQTPPPDAQSPLPALPWRCHWPDPEERELVAAYTRWQAPRLLTLPGLDDRRRAELELLARHQALTMAALWRVYPRVIHTELLTAARVEARLRGAVEPSENS
jgi:hypothetical protein